MLPIILTFACALLLSAGLTPAAASLGRRVGAVDRPLSLRKTHTGGVPRLGGAAILLAWLGGLGAALALDGDALGSRAAALAWGALAVTAVGLADDVRSLSPRLKLLGQILGAGIACAAGLRIEAVALPGGTLALGPAAAPFTILWIVGAVNAMNLIDGLDGLAGGIAVTAAVALVAIGGGSDPLLAASGAAIAGASIGFLRHNLRPGTIFMGDGGSHFLGFALAATAIPSADPAAGPLPLLPAILALALPGADTLLAILRRLGRASPLSSGDGEHLHHLAVARLGSCRAALLVLVGASALHGAAAVALSRGGGAAAAAMAAALLALDLWALRALGYLRPGLWHRNAAARRRNQALRQAVRSARAHLDAARDFADVRAALARAAVSLGARQARLLVREAAAPPPPLFTRHALEPGRPGGPALLLGWDVDSRLDRATEIAIEGLCAALAPALRRLEFAPVSRTAVPLPETE